MSSIVNMPIIRALESCTQVQLLSVGLILLFVYHGDSPAYFVAMVSVRRMVCLLALN